MKLDKPLNLDFDDSQPEVVPAQQLDELKKELKAKNKLLNTKNQEIIELKIKNRQLEEEKRKIQTQQKLMEKELRKAEAPIELIMESMREENENQRGNHG